MRRLRGWLAVIVCLALVGGIRASIPDFANNQLPVSPRDNVVAVRDFTAELILLDLARSLRSANEYAENPLTTDQAFVVARIKVTPHGNPMVLLAELHTSDGLTYTALRHADFPTASVFYVGQYDVESFIFEVPSDKIAGSWVGIRTRPDDGMQPVQKVARFDVLAEDPAVDMTIPAPYLGPAS